MELAQKLKKKGWDRKHIAKTLHILKKAEKKKHPARIWVVAAAVAFIITLGNILILTAMVPVMIEMPNIANAIFFTIIGVCFGALVDNLIRDFYLTRKHYFLAGVFLVGIALASMMLVVYFAEMLLKQTGLLIKINTLLMVSCYVVGFSLPHAVYKLKDKNESEGVDS